MEYQINENHLVVSQPDGSPREASFNWPIAQVLEVGNVLIVRVEPKIGTRDNQNVFGVGSDARVLWQVGQQQHIYDDSPYTGLSVVDDGVMLSNWDGTDLVISPTSGARISQSQGK